MRNTFGGRIVWRDTSGYDMGDDFFSAGTEQVQVRKYWCHLWQLLMPQLEWNFHNFQIFFDVSQAVMHREPCFVNLP
jgi:hypothetical protein